jgi:hypothetical protein
VTDREIREVEGATPMRLTSWAKRDALQRLIIKLYSALGALLGYGWLSG